MGEEVNSVSEGEGEGLSEIGRGKEEGKGEGYW